MSKQIILILGAGSNVGLSVAKKFAADGYEVALAARNMTDGTSPEGFKTFQADLSERASVSGVFAKLEASLGVPNVVVYNGRLSGDVYLELGFKSNPYDCFSRLHDPPAAG